MKKFELDVVSKENIESAFKQQWKLRRLPDFRYVLKHKFLKYLKEVRYRQTVIRRK